MEYEIIISNKTPEAILEIIPKYWILKKERFKYSIKEIVLNKLEIEKIIDEILKYSYCLLQTNPCRLCSSKSTIRINNRQHFSEVIKSKDLICDYCKMYSPNFIEDNHTSFDLEYNLGLLSDEEFNVLRGIIHLKTKFLIYRHIFNNDIEDISIWEIVNKIQKLGLIWIERDSSWRIKSFNFDPKLTKLISKLKF